MNNLKKLMEVGLIFHGHKCPAMPMGLRAGLAAMEALNVTRSEDKELFVYSETGDDHAAGCFLDGIMTATGCTYGKSNIKKLYYNKMAFTLIDKIAGKQVRISLKNNFFESALNSPFVQQRKKGILPQDIKEEVSAPLIEKIISLDYSMFLEIGNVETIEIKSKSGIFDAFRCHQCNEVTFVNKLRINSQKQYLCIPCSGYNK